MQRVVRSTLVGLLTLAGLTACGDKVTVPPPITPTTGTVVHGVTVTPNSVTLSVGQTAILAASVDADAGVTDRTVTWSSSDATVASVGTDGKVTAVKAGTVTVTAASKANPDVKGAALVTVTGSSAAIPTVIVSSVNQTNAFGQSVPANLAGAFGQLDVILNVDANGGKLSSISAMIKCGNDSLTQTQTISGNVAPLAAEAAAAPVTFSFNTAAFNTTTGVPALHNGTCTIVASAVGGSTATPQTATNTLALVLNNTDVVTLSESFAAITNIEGATQPTSAVDGGGLTWHGGSVTITALPVLYSNRTIASLTLTLPGATGASQTLTAAPFTATWSGSASSGSRVTGLTLVDQLGDATHAACNPNAVLPVVLPNCGAFEVNGTTPKGVVPTVIALDANGNDLLLALPNAAAVTAATFRLDNTPPQSPTGFAIPVRQAGWVNASYVFTGVGRGTSNANLDVGATNTTNTANYLACDDGLNVTGASAGPFPLFVGDTRVNVNQYACQNALGVSAGGLTTFSYYAIPIASYVAVSTTNGTSTSATACSITGWTKINTAGDLAATLVNTAYAVRVFEKDLLGNERCTDAASSITVANARAGGIAGSTIFNTGVANNFNLASGNQGKFGVDKVPPTVAFVEPSTDATAVGVNQAITAGGLSFKIAMTDDASGFGLTPIATKVTRLAIDPATLAASTTNSAFGCPIGFSASAGTCGTALFGFVVAADANSAGASSGVDGYYTYTGTATDLARNAAPTLTRTVVVDRVAPVMGGIAVPAAVTGGSSASFATSATDNLDLISSDYTITYPALPGGDPIGNFPIRAVGPALGVAFDNVLTNTASFSVNVPFFIRNMAATSFAGDAPLNNGVLPTQIAVRVYDAVNNVSPAGVAAIAPANVPQTTPTNYAAAQVNTATFSTFKVTNGVGNVSNCPAAGCAGGGAPANATSVVLTAAATGTEGATFQFLNPFTQVQFYYFDNTTNEWTLIGSAIAPIVTDNPGVSRTFTWSSAAFDPPATITSPLQVVAVGVNAVGDGLVTRVNVNTILTNP